MQHDDLGDRMKGLEAQETARRFIPGLPIYARIDGRGFSKFTRGIRKLRDSKETAKNLKLLEGNIKPESN